MKTNQCHTNSYGGKHNCNCEGTAKKCSFGKRRYKSKLSNTPILAKDILEWFEENHKELSALLEIK